jgi:hypothetical protein
VQLVSSAFNRAPRNDSALCLKCHQLGDQPLRPHGLAAAKLTQLRSSLPPPNKSGRTPVLLRLTHPLTNKKSVHDIACGTCHQEHHGANFDLTRLADAQCQSCHSVQFDSFEKGHPEFSGYPSQRRTRIFFDHDSHLGPGKHFEAMKDKAPSGCQSCHMPGAAGRFMQVKTFNNTCAACHSAQIKGEGMTVKGAAFFTVPGIDAETLAANGISIGQWPKFADGKITPFMQMFLNRQPPVRAALEQLRGVDLLDLTKATPAQLAAAEQFAWGVKKLLFHLVIEGQSYLLRETKGAIPSVGLEVPRAALIAAQEEWMPKVLGEVADYEKGIKPPLLQKPPPAPTASPSPSSTAPSDEGSLLGEDDLAAATPSPPAAKPSATPGDDLLVGGDDLAAATSTPSPSAVQNEALTSDDLSNATVPPPPLPKPAPTPEAMPAEEWVAAGGWYRPKDSFTLFYRPIGHADPFLAAWLTATAQLQSQDAIATAESPTAFRKLSDPQSPGLCMKCHTVEENHGVTTVNWSPAQPNAKSRPFTTFSHTTHFSLVGNKGCQTCHRLDSKSQYAKFFNGENALPAAHDPAKFQSNFAPLSKMLCAQCHQPRVAGDGCVLCHRYHAPVADDLAELGRFRTSLSTKLVPDGKTASAANQ